MYPFSKIATKYFKQKSLKDQFVVKIPVKNQHVQSRFCGWIDSSSG